jgi:hypothetical protein
LAALAAALALVPLLGLYGDWLDPWSLPERGSPERGVVVGDLTPQFAVWHRVTQASLWEDDGFPLWNRFTFAGEPFFGKPQVSVLSSGTVLGSVLPFPLGLKLDILLHLFLAALGTVALARRWGATWLVAAGVASLYVLQRQVTYHLNVGHLNTVNGLAWTPWLWWALLRALDQEEERPLRWAVVAGCVTAAQVLDGADLTLVWGYPAAALLVGASLLVRRWGGAVRRALAVGPVVLVVAWSLSAVRVLPLVEFMGLGNRREGVPWPAVTGLADTVPRPPVSYLAMGVALLAVLAWRRHHAVVVGLLLVGALGAAAAYSPDFYRVFYDHGPLFRDQRIPGRALWLTATVVPLLVALASVGVREALPRWGRAVDAGMAMVVVVMVAVQARDVPPRPRMADVRAEVAGNAFMQRVAQVAGDGRLNLFENEGRHWGAEHVTVPLGIEVTVGYEPAWLPEYLSPQFYLPEQVAFLDAAQRRPARTWGLVATSLVGSTRPRDVPGFRLREVTPRCPPTLCMPGKSAGPYLYDNLEALPRVFTADVALLFVGTGREADLAFQSLLLDDAWDPRRVVALRAGLRGDDVTQAQLDLASLLVLHPSARVPDALGAHLPALVKTDRTSLSGPARDAVAALSSSAPVIRALPWERRGTEQRACPTSGNLLVLSSKLALVPGWRAVAEDGRDLPVMCANGAATAVGLTREPGCVTLAYRPRAVAWGAAVTLVAVPVVAAVLLAPRRRRETARTTAGVDPAA